jgi:hypothetical protein
MTGGGQGGIEYSVSVTVVVRNVTVTVTLPGPAYYYVYYYYAYYAYPVPAVPVMVVVVLERLEVVGPTLVPEPVGFYAQVLQAYGEPHQLNVTFHDVEPGAYRVKVMFWNGLLVTLRLQNQAWKPLAPAYIWTVKARA